MTAEEAIATLKANYPDACYEQLREAVDMAIAALEQPTITHEQAIDYLHETGWLQNHDRILTESKIVPPVQLKNGTLIIPLNESDFKSVKRIMLDNKPWCRTFYEDVPGEAHWIKSYTPDDGEIYECDNCGVVWQFNDGGPEENEAFFCPKCGFKMERGDSE